MNDEQMRKMLAEINEYKNTQKQKGNSFSTVEFFQQNKEYQKLFSQLNPEQQMMLKMLMNEYNKKERRNDQITLEKRIEISTKLKDAIMNVFQNSDTTNMTIEMYFEILFATITVMIGIGYKFYDDDTMKQIMLTSQIVSDISKLLRIIYYHDAPEILKPILHESFYKIPTIALQELDVEKEMREMREEYERRKRYGL